MHWLVAQLYSLATVTGAICGWEGMKALDRRWNRKKA